MGFLNHIVNVWTSFFANHAALRTGVGFVHFAGLIGGGGCAIAADRATLRAFDRDDVARAHQLESIRNVHRIVLTGLAALLISGALLFCADLDTFARSLVFWVKMALVVLLVVNGVMIRRAEQRASTVAASWKDLKRGAVFSLLLWFAITLLGAALPNVG